jgi:oxygen-dependent protoporphyrinogen oxidase
MEVLIRRLAEILGPRLRLSTRVQDLRRSEAGFAIRAEGSGSRREIHARRVVLAAPSFANQALLREEFPDIASVLGEIPYAGITVACLIYERRQITHPLAGFGFLAPRGQGLRMLGCIWTGSIFPPHVPEGRVLLRAMVGGARDPEGAMLPSGRTVDLVHAELERVLGRIDGRPVETALYRHAKGIPQYTVGHPERMTLLEERLGRVPGLHVTGNAYRGIGVNDCVREAVALAGRLLAAGPEAPATVAAGERGNA